MTAKRELEVDYIQPELSVQECRNILCRNGEQYTDEEIKEIRTLILHLVEIDFHYFHAQRRKQQEEAKVINLFTNDQDQQEERRAA